MFTRLFKGFYWLLLEKNRSFWRTLRNFRGDIADQIRVLGVFIWYVVLGKAGSHRRVHDAVLSESPGKSLLMISYYSPPYKAAYGTERVAKLAKYLARMGWKITLLSSQPEEISETSTESESGIKGVDVVRVQGRRLKALQGKKFIVPDDFIGWVLPALDQSCKIAQDKKPTLIYATAPPYSNLLVGAISSRVLQIPLVSDFRDPWSKIDTFWTIERPILRTINRFLERAVLRVSHKIVMVDEKKYCDQYFVGGSRFAHKIESVSNGYDEEEFCRLDESPRSPESGKFVISYVGGIYDSETFLNLIRPLELWREAYPHDFDSVVFTYAGQSSQFFANYRPSFAVRDHGYVSHRDAIRIRVQSNLQLFAQPKSFKPHVSSGKVFEIIRVGVPVLAFTNPAGAVAEIVARTKTGYILRSGDHDGAAGLLKELYEKWRQGVSVIEPDRAAIMEYRRDRLSKKFSDVLEGVVADRPR